MTDIDIFGDVGPEPPKVGERVNGQYLLPGLDGKPRKYMSVTNLVDRLDDKWAINAWEKRCILLGLTVREDLYAKACGLFPTDKDGLDAILREAKVAGGGEEGANRGSALHGFFEHSDRGHPSRAPLNYRGHVEQYERVLAAHSIRVIPELIERTVVNVDLGYAGRFDNIVHTPDLGYVILDKKSQQQFFSWSKITAQQAAYARAPYMFDPVTGRLAPMPKVNPDVALILHCPLEGPHVGKMEMHMVDLNIGWEDVELAQALRLSRNRGQRKGAISRPYLPVPSAELLDRQAEFLDQQNKRDAEVA